MKKLLLTGLTVILGLLMLSSCEMMGDSFQSFHYSLHGVWATSPSSLQNIQLEIDYSTITIKGVVWLPNYPLYGFITDFPLTGYSEEIINNYSLKEGRIHIRNTKWEDPISYVYQSAGSQEIITLSSFGNDLTFHKIN